MKKILALCAVLIIAVSTVAPAFAQGDEVLIYPWFIPQDENGDRIVTVTTGDTILLGARWGACTNGLAQAWARTANVVYSVDDNLLISLEESRALWRRPIPAPIGTPGYCLNQSETGWFVYWVYELGNLPAGDYPAHVEYWNDQVPLDGGDFDGDGKVDIYQPRFSRIIDFTIHVVEP